MNENFKTPKIRFKGFTEDWEQRKLGDVIEDYVEKTTIQNQYPVLTSSQQYGIILQEDYFANRQITTDNNIGYFVLPKGYFTYRSRSDSNLFVFNRNNLINKGIISYYYPVFSSGKSDSNFLLRRLNYGIEDQLTMAAEGTGQRVLNHSSFKKMETHFPSNNEQIKIGLLFEKVDNLITLHQRKYDKLVNIKKSMLEKMFPKNDSKTPEIRFKGFTEDWEQRKLEDIVDFYRGHGLSWKDITENGFNKCILYGNLYTDYGMVINEVLRSTNNSKNDYFLSEVGDVLIPSSDTTETGLARASALNLKGIILGGDINVLRPKVINGLFLSYAINNKKNEMIKRIKGTTVRHLNNSDINDMILNITEDSKEQEKISNLIINIDNLITLHQRKLDKLNNFKKSMLEKMFV